LRGYYGDAAEGDELLEVAAIAANPADPLIKIGQARREFYANNAALAESILRETLSQQPQLGEAQARYGRIVVNRGDLAEFLAWRGSLPDDARDHPEVWYVQGLKARQLNQPGN
jgi:thioredoxin-like negative regulator of GroEL